MNWRKHITYPLIVRKNRSRELLYLKQLEGSQYQNREFILKDKLKKLQAILDYAYNNVPFYGTMFSDLGPDIKKVRQLEDLMKFPILTKRDIQEHREDLIARNIDRNRLIRDKTGGSTGSPLVFYYDKDRLDWRKASEIRHNRWVGYDIGMKCAVLWGARRDFFGRESLKSRLRRYLTSDLLVLDASSITDQAFDEFTYRLSTFKPPFILAYAQTLSYYARYLKANSIDVFSPSGIITSAELLTGENRTLIEDVFESTVFDRYGCREVSVIASECRRHTMHVNEECMHLEFVRDDGTPCDYGEDGKILVTDLLNYAMPLIRYEIGDRGIPVEENCSCGINLSSMRMSSGRTTDFIITPLGRKVSGASITAYVITNIEGLGRVQFYQKERGQVLVRIIRNDRFNDDTVGLLEERVKRFLDNIDMSVEFVENISLPESGKMQFCVNELLVEDKP